MPEDVPPVDHQHIQRIDWNKVDEALTGIFEILYNTGLTMIEQDSVVTTVWTKFTSEKISTLVEHDLTIKMSQALAEKQVEPPRPHYYG